MVEHVDSSRTGKKPRKPFTQFLVSHSDDKLDQLSGWANALQRSLEENPDKKVVVFTENAKGVKADSEKLTEKVLEGMLPSDAYAAVATENMSSYFAKNSTRVGVTRQRRIIKKEAEKARDQIGGGFFGRSFQLLDAIAAEYPGRIVFISEWEPELANQLDTQQKTRELGIGFRRELGLQTRAEKAASAREFFLFQADNANAREESAAQVLTDALDRDDVAAGVGWMGAAHTGLVHRLQANHDVRMIMPGKVGRDFVYTPENALIRERLFHPDRDIDLDEAYEAVQIERRVRRQYPIFHLGIVLESKWGINPFHNKQRKAEIDQEISRRAQVEFQAFRAGRNEYAQDQNTIVALPNASAIVQDNEVSLRDMNSGLDWDGSDGPDQDYRKTL